MEKKLKRGQETFAYKRPHNQGEKHRQIITSATWDTVLRAGRSAAQRTNSDTGTRRSWLGPLSGNTEARRRAQAHAGSPPCDKHRIDVNKVFCIKKVNFRREAFTS